MNLKILIGLIFISTIKCDLLDEQFFLYILDNSLRPATEGFEPPALIRTATVHLNAAYDALCPYLKKSIGLTSRIPKRPESEWTVRNKNIAVGYAMYRCAQSLLPNSIPTLTQTFQALGLDVNDRSMNLSTPIGIGNYAAKKVLEIREYDGMNQLGDLSKSYNRMPYDDYTGYIPKNNPYWVSFPGNWQPNIETDGFGKFFIQRHIFPQFGRVLPYSLKNVSQFVSPVAPKSNPVNFRDYKRQVDELLLESANLNDYRKMVAEHFDDKSRSLFGPIFFLAQKYRLSQDDIIILDFLTNMALFDAGIVVWKEKINHDLVRPFSAIRFIYGKLPITAWGGPGKGTVKNIKGNDWKSYIRTAGHSEYPSGSSCFCSAQFTVLEKYFNTSEFGFAVFKTKGSSQIEPGITPSRDILLGPYPTFQSYIDDCANSRLWGGVHFKSSLDEGKRLCKPIGEIVYNYLIKYIDGTVDLK